MSANNMLYTKDEILEFDATTGEILLSGSYSDFTQV
jgi:hypothetical protein